MIRCTIYLIYRKISIPFTFLYLPSLHLLIKYIIFENITLQSPSVYTDFKNHTLYLTLAIVSQFLLFVFIINYRANLCLDKGR